MCLLFTLRKCLLMIGILDFDLSAFVIWCFLSFCLAYGIWLISRNAVSVFIFIFISFEIGFHFVIEYRIRSVDCWFSGCGNFFWIYACVAISKSVNTWINKSNCVDLIWFRNVIESIYMKYQIDASSEWSISVVSIDLELKFLVQWNAHVWCD